jgi:pimeloyl-ACP methyl ester carboxylesterase
VSHLGETSYFVRAHDATRIWVRTRPWQGRAQPGPGEHVAPAEHPTALLSDGIACSGFIWRYLWDELSTHLDVAHYNYRGHGRSAVPADPQAVTFDDVVRDHDAARASLGGPPVVLVGHSMGCQVALESYRRDPSRVAGMVLLCGAPGRITHTFRGTDFLARVLPEAIKRVEAYPSIARALWSRVHPEVALRMALLLGEVDAAAILVDDLRPYLEHMVDLDLLLYLKLLYSAGERSAMDMLSSIRCPVLVVAGERDSFTPPARAEEMAALIPDAELLVVKGGTHAVPIERRDLMAETIGRFLREKALPLARELGGAGASPR